MFSNTKMKFVLSFLSLFLFLSIVYLFRPPRHLPPSTIHQLPILTPLVNSCFSNQLPLNVSLIPKVNHLLLELKKEKNKQKNDKSMNLEIFLLNYKLKLKNQVSLQKELKAFYSNLGEMQKNYEVFQEKSSECKFYLYGNKSQLEGSRRELFELETEINRLEGEILEIDSKTLFLD